MMCYYLNVQFRGQRVKPNLLKLEVTRCTAMFDVEKVLHFTHALNLTRSFWNSQQTVILFPHNWLICISNQNAGYIQNILVQDDLGERIYIVGNYSIGHSEGKKGHINMCLILNCYRDTAVCLSGPNSFRCFVICCLLGKSPASM